MVDYDRRRASTPEWERITNIASAFHVIGKVTPDSFPALFRSGELERTGQAGKTLFTVSHSVQPYGMEDLLDLPEGSRRLDDLIYKQKAEVFPSTELKEESMTTILPSHFINARGIPDRRYPSLTGKPDSNVNVLLAATVISRDSPVQNPQELTAYASQRGLGIDLIALHEGFNTLVTKPMVDLLSDKGVLKPETLRLHFADAADWMLLLAISRQKNRQGKDRRGNKIILPFTPYDPVREQPHIEFLPEMARLALDHLAILPDTVPKERSFDPLVLRDAIQNVFKTSNNVLNGYQGEHIDPSSRVDIADSVQSLKPDFMNMLAFYIRHPEILRGRTPNPTTASDEHTYYSIRDRILEAGGRAPRLSLSFKTRTGTPQGRI